MVFLIYKLWNVKTTKLLPVYILGGSLNSIMSIIMQISVSGKYADARSRFLVEQPLQSVALQLENEEYSLD